ncbi:MAG: hypothetical protein G01um10147_193 [Microgenomates group bacterium Gr01-1014_7]|nr:MAG: hypothetical protein G01um10147_193 [Microgenomates group bacterium Gr01-1014_7]
MAIAELDFYTSIATLDPRPTFPSDSILNDRRILLVHARLPFYDGYVPLDLIDDPKLPVDHNHIDSLSNLFDEAKDETRQANPNTYTTGQASEITLGEVRGHPLLDPTDGLHRLEILRGKNEQFAYAAIKPDCTRQEIVKYRISATKDHPSVRFPRMVQYLHDSWELTPWIDLGMTVTQAFILRYSKRSTGKNLHLTPTQVLEVRDWVDQSCSGCSIGANIAYVMLKIADVADPELVKSVRERKSGNHLTALTGEHLANISRPPTLCHRYDLQNTLAEAILKESLTVDDTKQLVSVVVRRGVQTPDEIRAIFESGTWRTEEVELVYGRRNIRKPARLEVNSLTVQLAEAIARAQGAEDERDNLKIQLDQVASERDVLAKMVQALENQIKELKVASTTDRVSGTIQSQPGQISTRPSSTPEPQPRIYQPSRPTPNFFSETRSAADIPDIGSDDVRRYLARWTKEKLFQTLSALGKKPVYETVPDSAIPFLILQVIRFTGCGIQGNFLKYDPDKLNRLIIDEVKEDIMAILDEMDAHPERVNLLQVTDDIANRYLERSQR